MYWKLYRVFLAQSLGELLSYRKTALIILQGKKAEDCPLEDLIDRFSQRNRFSLRFRGETPAAFLPFQREDGSVCLSEEELRRHLPTLDFSDLQELSREDHRLEDVLLRMFNETL